MPFIEPPPFGTVGDYSDNPDYGIGQPLSVQWMDAPTAARLVLVKDQDGGLCEELGWSNTLCEILIGNFAGSSNRYSWTVKPVANATDPPIYYLMMRDVNNVEANMLSHYFNIKPANEVQSSTSTSTVSSTTTSEAASTTSLTATSSTTTQPTAAPSGLDSGTKTAIGVGVGLSVPLLAIIGVVAFFWIRRNKRSRHDAIANSSSSSNERHAMVKTSRVEPNFEQTRELHGNSSSPPPPTEYMPMSLARDNYAHTRPAWGHQPSELSDENAR